MKNFVLISAGVFYFLQLISSCASQQPPTGGTKDTIPPTLISTYPEQKSLNFNSKEIRLAFSESIKENQLNSKLIITPDDQNKFTATIRRNQLTLEFENDFSDSTTYTLNFNNSIEDITEGNDAENIILAFSTTTYIDSLAISGVITDMLSAQPLADVTVALYQAEDTTHIFNKRPLYFTKTDEEGSYSLENLKRGNYRIYAFDDQNKNNLCESDAEKHGFVADTLDLVQNLDSINIPVIVNDIKPLNLIATRTTGTYFESRYNKSIKDYSVSIVDSSRLEQWNIYTSLTEDLRGILFYPHTNPKGDSLLVSLTAIDSTNNTITDSLYIKFVASRRTKQPFTYTVKPPTQSEITPETVLSFKFNKPIISYIDDSLKISIDTLLTKPLIIDSTLFNDRKNKLDVYLQLNPMLIASTKDSLKTKLDSLQADTTDAAYSKTKQIHNQLAKVKDNYVRIKIAGSAFITVDKDTSVNNFLEYRFLVPEDKGIIRGIVDTDYPDFTIQLIDSKYSTVKSVAGTRNFEFKNIGPGDYSLRFLIDENNDGEWSAGNSLKWIEPEPVYLYPVFFNVRANWIMDNIEVEF